MPSRSPRTRGWSTSCPWSWSGLVGAGALGYDVVAGFSQGQLYGKGLAAGLAIVLLGVMFDRITQAAAHRAANAPGGR